MDRSEHLQWSKDGALEYLPDNPSEAFASMTSDLEKHDDLIGHPAILLGTCLMMTPGWIDDHVKVRDFVTGFN